MTYSEWLTLYKTAFNNAMSYRLGTIGAELWITRMAELAEKYPKFEERFDNSI